MEPSIIFEDEYLLVINKPAGWIVNEASTTKGRPVLQDWLSGMQYPLAQSREFRSGIVHRLDKETSGVLVVAKTQNAFELLQQQFKEREIQKEYIALVHGRVYPHMGTVEVAVGRLPWKRDRFGVLPGGRESKTDYETRGYYSNGKEEFTLLELKPHTGRTHQIRIHLKYIQNAIVSDDFYAGRKTARNDRKWCPRLFLHALEIRFNHPVTGNLRIFRAELPSDLKGVLSKLTRI
ncbi:RluA family pseudouridine synthase [Candidatus Woesebacteria bacterium]|nr:RluA family pseudouridine synthase [Candidatus Woesebacteria bacterium]